MADQQHQPGELALVKAVRSLDQGGSETTPDKLDQIWKILSIYAGGKFHAAEEMLVRWLLKNMNGASDDAERLRRYPLTWRILGRVFSSVPLFSLAKSLADRRFVTILQNALKDASEPQEGSVQVESSDTEMADAGSEDAPRPSKRKRSDRVTFDTASQRSLDGCLRTAESLFEAIRLLLSRLESDTPKNAKGENHMGAEHIKSLFRSSAGDIKDLILPAFNVCKLAVENAEKVELRDGQESWISTICSIWDLHLQGEADVFQVATYLSPPTVHILGRLTDIPLKSCAIDIGLRNRWEQDVRRFLTRNLILPTRTAFLNRGSIENIRLTVDLTLGFSTMSCPVIFDLVLSSPQLSGGQSSKRDNDSWVQAVFSLLDETLRSSKSKHKLVAVMHMMNNVCEHGVSLSLESLRSFCNNYALQPKQVEWRLLLLVAKINPDTFIVGEGDGLLRAILSRTNLEDAWGPLETDLLTAQEFIIALAEGYAKARDLSGFVKLWFDGLCSTERSITDISSTDISPHYHLWLNEKLRTTVAEPLEKTMNTKQILTLLDWLDLQAEEDSILKGACVTLILSAVSEGITQDDVIDSVGTRLVDTVFAMHSPARCSHHVLASRWIVARRSLAWATSAQREHIWTVTSPGLAELLKSPVQYDPSDYGLLSFREAVKFSLAAWSADHPGGTHEEPAAKMTIELISRLDDTVVTYKDYGLFFDDLVADCPRLFSMIIERGIGCCPRFLKAALSFKCDDPSNTQKRMLRLFENDNTINSRATMDMLLKLVVAELGTYDDDELLQLAAEALLALPLDAIPRDHRENLMSTITGYLVKRSRSPKSLQLPFLKAVASLMVKLMRKSTFYNDMAFSDVDRVAQAFALLDDKMSALQYRPLVEELATLSCSQMTANIGQREQDYLRAAVESMVTDDVPTRDVDVNLIFRTGLLKTLILAGKSSSASEAISDLHVDELEGQLKKLIEAVVKHFCDIWKDTSCLDFSLQSLSVVIGVTSDLKASKTADGIYSDILRGLSPYLPRLKEASETLRLREDVDVWSLRKFLIGVSESTSSEALLDLGEIPLVGSGDGQGCSGELQLAHKDGILGYVDAVVRDGDDKVKIDYISSQLTQRPEAPNRVAKLLAVHRIVEKLGGSTSSHSKLAAATSKDETDLGTLHTALCKRLRQSETAVEFVLISQILQTIMDEHWNTMTQWNVELTLSTVSTLASQATTHKVISTTPKAYECLCRLVQTIVRRHRLRLEGHFHLLITVLQSLLRSLISNPYDNTGNVWTTGLIKDPAMFSRWEKHAKAFARLLTMVCEPTPGSVARSQQGSLDSATDAAKRYAGQHMYLVLMMYIKLQLEQNVPHDVREALEPGVFAILDITSPEGRRIMNDALDGSGRAIMKELYKQYVKFGKWSGI